MFQRLILAVLFVLFGNFAIAEAQPIRDITRGELLYSTHCIACHTTQVHWREKKLVTNWTSLQLEVRRWQGVSKLGWSNEDIEEVARYLNVTYYHYPTIGLTRKY
jgi:mono/diheme cytochrome c family protein